MSILEDAQRALELEQKATPGPWCHMQPGVRSLYNEWYDTYDWLSDNPQAGLHKKIIASRGSFYGGEPDYAFVAAARTGWPTTAQALIDLHKAAQEVVAGYSEEKCAFCGAWIEDSHANKLPHRKHCAFAALAAVLEELR